MRLLNCLLLAAGISAQGGTKCPEGWVPGQSKCFKFIGGPKSVAEAGKACTSLGGLIFMPDSEQEYNFIKLAASKLRLNIDKHRFWLRLKLKDTGKFNFPPELQQLNKAVAPEWLESYEVTRYYGKFNGIPISKFIKQGRNRRAKLEFMISQGGKFQLVKRGSRGFVAGALCEMPKSSGPVGDPNTCWQPASDQSKGLSYTGTLAHTNNGFECVDWEDESESVHKVKPSTPSANYCRNPDGGADGPWCYIKPIPSFHGNTTAINWENCPVPLCQRNNNEFVETQQTCGYRPLTSKITKARIINGEPAKPGEIPWQARIRYYKNMRFGSQSYDHQCGASLISSCWAVTAAHCVPTDGWFNDRGEAEFWFRLDVGSRGHHSDATNFGSNCHGDNIPKELKDKELNCADIHNHQTLRVKKAIIHKHYRTNDNDIALLQLYPTEENGQCAKFNDYVQPVCINTDPFEFSHGKPEATSCLISGWGDINADMAGVQHSPQLMKATVDITDFMDCKRTYQRLKKRLNPKRHICAYNEGSKDTCQGDSGGPLVCQASRNGEEERSYLVGVVSFGAGCAEEGYPGVYVPLSRYYNWIRQQVDANPPVEYNELMVCKDSQCL